MEKNLKKIKLLDSNFAHAKYSTDYQKSKYFEWDRTKSVSENEPIFYSDKFLSENSGNPKNQYAWLLEPTSISPQTYNYIKNNNHKFDKVLTYDRELLDKGENFIFYPHGGCWIPKEQQKIYEKSKLFSIISSSKKQTIGHNLRHKVINEYKDIIDVYGRGYNPVKLKTEALKEYMFSITIENVKKDYYFTEKLIDCFMTGTIPIYYGCPSIDKFFDVNGVIVFNNLGDLNNILHNLNKDYYNSKSEIIESNFEAAKKYLISEDWIYENTNIL
jgi:hypothetical protein